MAAVYSPCTFIVMVTSSLAGTGKIRISDAVISSRPMVVMAVSYTHLDVYKRQALKVVPLKFNSSLL